MLCLWRRLAFSLRNRDSRVSRASLAHRPRKVQPVPPTGDQQTPFLCLKVWERWRRSARSYLPPRRLEGSLKSFWIIAKRSEEHTSELQSHSDLVCRLLLEKKNKHPVLLEPMRCQPALRADLLRKVLRER